METLSYILITGAAVGVGFALVVQIIGIFLFGLLPLGAGVYDWWNQERRPRRADA